MTRLLAIDQGQFKTVALVCDDQGHFLGVGYGPGACHTHDGIVVAMASIGAACRSALRQGGIALDDVHMICAGISGADWPPKGASARSQAHSCHAPPNGRCTNQGCLHAARTWFTEQTYQHVLPEMDQNAADKIERIFH